MPVQKSELLEPIAGANPGGADIRYQPLFDQIKRARVEEADLPAGDWSRERKTADYGLVVKLATEALRKHSKDLQIAAWLTEALLKREQLGGLASGLEVLRELLDGFWEHLYPEVDDGDLEFRVAPLEWVAAYLETPVRLVPITTSGLTIFAYRESRAVGYEADADSYEKTLARDAAITAGKLSAEAFDEAFTATPKAWYKQLISDIDSCLRAVDALDLVGQQKFGPVAPRYAPIRDAVLEVRQVAAQLLARKLELEPDPIEPVAEAAEVGEDLPGAEGAAAGAPAATVSATPKTRSDAEARIAAAARFLRAEDPKNPAPYLLLRGFRWGELRTRGGSIDPKLLAAPPTELRARLRGLLLDGSWANLLEAAEEVMATPYGRGWLDLQRYVLTACANLGSDYDEVAAAIRGALQSLLQDLPHLPDQVLMDDTATANADTLAWLRDTVGAAAGTSALRPGDAERFAVRAPFDRAMERVRAGEPDKAVELLMRQAAQEQSPRERFLRRAEAASIMVESGREAIALPILEQLLQEIDRHTLEDWETGDTVARPLALLYRCLRRVQPDASATESLYLRICRLDPMQAMQLSTTAE